MNAVIYNSSAYDKVLQSIPILREMWERDINSANREMAATLGKEARKINVPEPAELDFEEPETGYKLKVSIDYARGHIAFEPPMLERSPVSEKIQAYIDSTVTPFIISTVQKAADADGQDGLEAWFKFKSHFRSTLTDFVDKKMKESSGGEVEINHLEVLRHFAVANMPASLSGGDAEGMMSILEAAIKKVAQKGVVAPIPGRGPNVGNVIPIDLSKHKDDCDCPECITRRNASQN